MLYSSSRKRVISGWLRKHNIKEFYSALKFQKFLFFYETLSKIENDTSELVTLKGYVNGPVFSDVYGDYTHEYDEFIANSDALYQANPQIVNEDRAKFACFFVKILNEDELSHITHKFNIWNSKKEDINRGVRNVRLSEEDFNESDVELLQTLRNSYSTEFIDSVKVVEISGKSFVVDQELYKNLSEEQRSLFITLANEESLLNPVYVTLSEDGVVLVD